MKTFYPLATLLLASSLFFSFGAQAQTYFAVRNGNWHVTSGAGVWDPSGEPPVSCIGCTITIKSGVTVTLNRHVTLSGGSLLQVGDDASQGSAVLLIPSSGGTDWATSYNVILPNDGSDPSNSLTVNDGSAFLNASGAGKYDGVLTSFISGGMTSYFKQLGNAPGGFVETTVASNSPSAYGKTLSGPSNLNANGTLPISLTDFDAVLNNGSVDLRWRTLMEVNSDHFDIERSTNGGAKWDVIGKVAAHGFSAAAVSYFYADATPASGTNSYRIHGYDKDGRSTFSPIKVVRTTPIANVSVFPNPAKDYVNVSLPVAEATTGAVSIRLIGQSGQLLAEKTVSGAGGTTLSFAVSNYPPGQYLVQVITADGARQVNKVFISRN